MQCKCTLTILTVVFFQGTDKGPDTEHIVIIMVIFSLILSGMCFTFIYNCVKKLIRDHHIIQVREARERTQIIQTEKNTIRDFPIASTYRTIYYFFGRPRPRTGVLTDESCIARSTP